MNFQRVHTLTSDAAAGTVLYFVTDHRKVITENDGYVTYAKGTISTPFAITTQDGLAGDQVTIVSDTCRIERDLDADLSTVEGVAYIKNGKVSSDGVRVGTIIQIMDTEVLISFGGEETQVFTCTGTYTPSSFA